MASPDQMDLNLIDESPVSRFSRKKLLAGAGVLMVAAGAAVGVAIHTSKTNSSADASSAMSAASVRAQYGEVKEYPYSDQPADRAVVDESDNERFPALFGPTDAADAKFSTFVTPDNVTLPFCGPQADGATYIDSLGVPTRPISGMEAELESTPNPVVVAVLDSGINPYHPRFRRCAPIAESVLEKLNVDRVCKLSLDDTDFTPLPDLIAQDSECWANIQEGEIIYFEGTSIVSVWVPGTDPESIPIYGVASTHGNRCAGAVLNGNNEAIIFAMKYYGDSNAAVQYAAAHPAVDVVTTSFGAKVGTGVGSPIGINEASRSNNDNGVIHFGSCPNLGQPCVTYATGGTPWTIGLGGFGVDGSEGKTYTMSGNQPDFVGDWTQTLANYDANNMFYGRTSGTSFATPLTAGWVSGVIMLLRKHYGDFTVGTKGRYLVVDSEGNPVVSYADLRDALEKVAYYPDPLTWNPTNTDVVFNGGEAPIIPLLEPEAAGWGLLEPKHMEAVVEHIIGTTTLPARPADIVLKMGIYRDIAVAFYGQPPADPQ